VVNVDLATVLDCVASEGAYPAARYNSTLFVRGKSHSCAGGCDQCLSSTVLAIAISVISSMPESRSLVGR
jgi:hypothetical protein